MVDVTAAVIVRGGRVLLCQRPKGKSCAGLWEFPGGKVESGETLAACLARECREELGVCLRVGRTLCAVTRGELRITFLLAEIAQGQPQLREHSAMIWATPEQARAYALCPSDREALPSLDLEALCAQPDAPDTDDENAEDAP